MSKKSEEKAEKPKEWTTIKLPKETKEKLEKMGKGIGKAIETLVEEKEDAVSKHLEEIRDIGDELVEELLESGFLDIRFAGINMDDVFESGTQIVVKGTVRVEIPDEHTRKTVIDILAKREVSEGGEVASDSE